MFRDGIAGSGKSRDEAALMRKPSRTRTQPVLALALRTFEGGSVREVRPTLLAPAKHVVEEPAEIECAAQERRVGRLIDERSGAGIGIAVRFSWRNEQERHP